MQQSGTPERLALVFDWGGTLMKVFPQYTGAMVDWPEVAAEAGAVEALATLRETVPMVVATNAADSTSEQIMQALQMVGLGENFRAVFTGRELGSRKPELAFFRALESVLAHPPHAMVMTGDDYRSDVLGAKAAGWRAVWYNPGFLSPPGGIPLHDSEIHHMGDFPRALARLALPDVHTCLAWLESAGTPYNVIVHLQLASVIAYHLALWLAEKGEAVDPILTHRGGLLHDIAKLESIRLTKEQGTYVDHADLARDRLLERGQPELAEIAGRHMLYQSNDDPRRPQTWEQRLVHFADKLAEGSTLVSITERAAALKGRYPQSAAEIDAAQPFLLALQDEICAILSVMPEEMLARLRAVTGLWA